MNASPSFVRRRCGVFTKITIGLAAIATLGLPEGTLRAAKGDIDVLVAPDRTAEGKNFVPPTAEKPRHCIIHSAGPMELGAVYAGEKIPREEEVAPHVKKALASQHYLEIDKDHPEPSLLIVYSWGSINADETELGEEGGTATTQRHTAEMLGIVSTNKMDLRPHSFNRKHNLPDLSEGRYFILFGAYDYAALKAGKPRRQTMLWRTRLSIYNTGRGSAPLAEAIPRMLEVGASSFGADGYPVELRNKLKKGKVTLGEAEVVEYVISGTDVKPAPRNKTNPKAPKKSKNAK
ncbi:hypothetical protein M2103_001600 [Ereboglobus sp. PH5-5]|uniref:hypothetical protein n=1 Tax=Ereboglobus sp. PH5-5 TaxID=2940529 RepID=UPI002404920F|nr:hypothetical protein [Ereboglobus sp. PH5-5]MDF9833376.1 hypothetical protein [Ereboglobus sp. PH5-5]